MPIEERLHRIERSLQGHSDETVPNVSKPLYTKLKLEHDKETQRMLDETTASLARIVPCRFLSKIPQTLHDKLYIGLGNVQCDPHIARSLLMSFLKAFTEADEEFIEWLTQHVSSNTNKNNTY